MIPISEIYADTVLDNINAVENGNVTYSMFNRISKRAELRLLDFLSGDIDNEKAPAAYISQKDRDWLSIYIKKYPQQVIDSKITKPQDYYGYENMYLLGNYNKQIDCEEENTDTAECNTPIELLAGDKYNERCRTFIEGKEPSFSKPIVKEVGNTFEFNPRDLGSIELEYIAFPVYGKIVTKFDPIYHEEVIDEDKSTNYQYPEWARELLIFFMSDFFVLHTRENALKQQLELTGKLVREGK